MIRIAIFAMLLATPAAAQNCGPAGCATDPIDRAIEICQDHPDWTESCDKVKERIITRHNDAVEREKTAEAEREARDRALVDSVANDGDGEK